MAIDGIINVRQFPFNAVGGSTQCDLTCNGTNWIETGSASY
jgi:hypothetical protein